MEVGDGEEAEVNALLYINTSDLPASRKLSGTRGHTCIAFMCTVCHQSLHSLGDPKCYDADSE